MHYVRKGLHAAYVDHVDIGIIIIETATGPRYVVKATGRSIDVVFDTSVSTIISQRKMIARIVETSGRMVARISENDYAEHIAVALEDARRLCPPPAGNHRAAVGDAREALAKIGNPGAVADDLIKQGWSNWHP